MKRRRSHLGETRVPDRHILVVTHRFYGNTEDEDREMIVWFERGGAWVDTTVFCCDSKLVAPNEEIQIKHRGGSVSSIKNDAGMLVQVVRNSQGEIIHRHVGVNRIKS